MTDLTLTKGETAILSEAARRTGELLLPTTMKRVTAERLMGKLLKHGLVTPSEQEGTHHLTPAGYRAVGLKAPRARRTGEASGPRASKQDLVLGLLGRGEGASVAELMAATGWLPHTTRAALSRIRTGGQALGKAKRPDGVTAYRIMAEEPEPAHRARKSRGEVLEAAATP